MKAIALSLLLPSFLSAAPGLSEEEGVRRIAAHMLVEDSASALREGQELYEAFEGSRAIGSAYIEALSFAGDEERALAVWRRLSGRYPDMIQERHLLEELCWGVLRRGIESTQYGVRLASLIGTYLTHDVRAVKVLLRMMRDSNALIRSVAIQMAASYGDASLKDEIERLFSEEKVWMVRLEVIRAVGALRMKALAPKLKAVLDSEKNTFEERESAAEALVGIYDKVSMEELSQLARNSRFGMRQLACLLAQHFEVKEAKEAIVKLASDPHPDVRTAALNAIGLVYVNEPLAQEAVKERLQDAKPSVAITAAWAAALFDPKLGEQELERWIKSDLPENRRLASAALSATGARCLSLSKRVLEESADAYVTANVAIGLIGQRAEIERSSETLYQFMMKEKRMWMWDTAANPLFKCLCPSRVRHVDQIPNYPEAVDQMTRLNLVSLLALVDDPRAVEVLKSFLQRKSWGITGVAAATLLHEGDEGALEVVKALQQDPDANVRLQACLVLAMFGHDDSVLLDLEKAYAGGDHEQKLRILEALGRIGTNQTYSFFVGVLEEPFQILRIAAAAGLIQGLNR